MQHQLIVLRGPRPTYLGAIYHTAHMESLDAVFHCSQSIDRAGLLSMLESAIDDDGSQLGTHRVLSIDAWRDGDGWTWNAWYKRGTITKREFRKLLTNRQLCRFMREHGYLSAESAGRVAVVDDGYNVEFQDRGNGEPLFAIEYGNED
jgi:hypothetical protein